MSSSPGLRFPYHKDDTVLHIGNPPRWSGTHIFSGFTQEGNRLIQVNKDVSFLESSNKGACQDVE